jgi:hypothetical protein
MGKVSSTSMARALVRRGFKAMQAHVASPDRLLQKLDTLFSPALSEDVAVRVYQDYLRELEVTFLLARRRISGASRQGPLLVISPMRDPMSWYWSHFAELYQHYREQLLRFHLSRGHERSRFDPAAAFTELQQSMFGLLSGLDMPLDRVSSLQAIKQQADKIDPTNIVYSQINRFLLPLRWYDEDFLPATGIDVYEHAFDRDSGCSIIEGDGLSILLMRYEKLDSLQDVVARFLGQKEFTIGLDNVSSAKQVPFDLPELRRQAIAMMEPDLLRRIYETRYATHFGYALEGG